MNGDRGDLLVAAIGNPDRGDDGVGPAVARKIKRRASAGVRVIECSDILGLIDEWMGCAAAILVDASEAAGHPGRIRRLDLIDSRLPADFAPNSTHAFGLAETIELARALGQLPQRLVAYLIEGERFEIGAALSPRVAAASESAEAAIFAELAQIGEADQPD